MTDEQIKALPTVSDLAKWQHEQIAAKQAEGAYNYDTLQTIIAERDAKVVRERVTYNDQDGNENWYTVYGNARERYQKKAAFIREQEQMDNIVSHTRATKDRI
jgi:nuclear transport factor 2 (NTF2) superfamily protein